MNDVYSELIDELNVTHKFWLLLELL